ncbi:BamA/TamA family outer membrane protein [Sphingomonas sp. KR3-1]|uniref:BamA/TamA family outer membrane protein n=1 Tax=Sphingomonas sp. KR3-1 TaxID=3156611 RepID=UPI0032B45676
MRARAALPACLLAATPATAQDRPQEQIHDQAMTLTSAQAQAAPDKPEKKKKADLLIVPIPLSSPSLGTGATVAAVLFYNPNHAPQPWISGIGAMATSTGTKAIGAFHTMSLGHDSVRFMMFGGYGDAKLKFYGIGSAAGNRGAHVDLEDKAILGLVQAQVRVARYFYGGVRIQYLDLDSKAEVPHPNYPDLALPPLELKSTLATIGPSLTYDSRDSSLNPRSGAYITGTWMFDARFLGSDFDHAKLQLGASLYGALARGTTVAVRGSTCSVTKRVPFYDLCMYGQGGDLRGYETGRYRDRASWAVQGEFRQHLFGKFGAVAFGGLGGVASSLQDVGRSDILPSVGAGLRFQASKSNNVNLRLDLAFGRDGHAVYFGIGEAF